LKKGEGRAWNRTCTLSEYNAIMEIDDAILVPEGYQLIFELVEPKAIPWVSTYSYARIIQQHFFKVKGNIPWIVVSLYEMTTPSSIA